VFVIICGCVCVCVCECLCGVCVSVCFFNIKSFKLIIKFEIQFVHQ